jgi:hypothetical protein
VLCCFVSVEVESLEEEGIVCCGLLGALENEGRWLEGWLWFGCFDGVDDSGYVERMVLFDVGVEV